MPGEGGREGGRREGGIGKGGGESWHGRPLIDTLVTTTGVKARLGRFDHDYRREGGEGGEGRREGGREGGREGREEGRKERRYLGQGLPRRVVSCRR